MQIKKKTPWYVGGLAFECMQCGRCCAGPSEGYIWVAKPEIKLIADFLKMTPAELRRKFLKRVGLRTTIIEDRTSRDCIFLKNEAGKRKCMIYSVRPNQCRIWPFWPSNLKNPNTWNETAQKCTGINRGKFYSYEEIQKIQKQKWWQNEKQQPALKKVAEIYNWLDLQMANNSDLIGQCKGCGECCVFDEPASANKQRFDHRLFLTTPELIYLTANLGGEGIKPMLTSHCPYNIGGKCSIYKYRFAGCRIFYCRGDKDFQSRLSESALKRFKLVCEEFGIAYNYTDLATALNNPVVV